MADNGREMTAVTLFGMDRNAASFPPEKQRAQPNRQASAGLDGDLENITAPPTALPFPGHSACLLFTNYLSSSVLQQGINGVMN